MKNLTEAEIEKENELVPTGLKDLKGWCSVGTWLSTYVSQDKEFHHEFYAVKRRGFWFLIYKEVSKIEYQLTTGNSGAEWLWWTATSDENLMSIYEHIAEEFTVKKNLKFHKKNSKLPKILDGIFNFGRPGWMEESP